MSFIEIKHYALKSDGEGYIASEEVTAVHVNKIVAIEYNKVHYRHEHILNTEHIICVERIVNKWDNIQRIMFQIPSRVEMYVKVIPPSLKKMIK